LEVVD
jgi:nitrite reductase/ring-hydroxylating ferredoxin subunit